jgi:alkylhydroperoxidase/carboxymuconolactone decarboxylase family protein YurZ
LIAVNYLPDVFQRFEHAYPEIHAAHTQLAKSCYEAGPLDARSARLVKLGIALGAMAEGSVRSHARRALDEGASPEEIRHVALLALTTIGFPHTVAGLGWIEEVLANRA